MPTAREIALRHLERVEEEGAFIPRLDPETDDPRDIRLTTDLVAGVTRWRRWLDFLIDHFYRGESGSLDPVLRQILRMGLYELLVRETAPHAAVNETVTLARRAHHRGGAGLVNGILRSVERSRTNLPEPDTDDEAEQLAIRFSHPSWLVRRWLAAFGLEETESLLRRNNEVPRMCLRFNTLQFPVEALQKELVALDLEVKRTVLDDFVRVSRLQPIRKAGLLEQGHVAVQDVAAGCVVRVLDPQPGERILDAAAAPGGKALYTTMRMGDKGEVVALDIHPGKTKLIEKAARVHGLRTIRTVCADLRKISPESESGAGFDEPFDRVLLDAPCSGTGVLAKRADLRWRLTEQRISELTALQDELLDAAARFVRPGGLLVYATCSIEAEENHQRVEAFLDTHADFYREVIPEFLSCDFATPDNDFQALPHVHGTDGAYAARLRRKDPS